MFSDFRNKKRTRVSFCDRRTRPLLGSNRNDSLVHFTSLFDLSVFRSLWLKWPESPLFHVESLLYSPS